MSTKRAGIAPIGSKDLLIELSFDNQLTWKEFPGVMDFDMSSGQASIYEGTPLREEPFLRFGALSSGAMSMRVFQTPQLDVFDKLVKAQKDKSLLYARPAVPREVIASFRAASNPPTSVAIDSADGTVTFVPANFAIGDQPLGKGCVIEIGQDNFVVETIEINAQGNATAKVFPTPQADIAASDADIVLPGLRWDPMGIFVSDYADTFGNDGAATTAFNLRVQGQPTRARIDRTVE